MLPSFDLYVLWRVERHIRGRPFGVVAIEVRLMSRITFVRDSHLPSRVRITARYSSKTSNGPSLFKQKSVSRRGELRRKAERVRGDEGHGTIQAVFAQTMTNRPQWTGSFNRH